jgi:hypothetical protein
MTNVAHNGFGCPYCRTAMAEVPEDEESDYDRSIEEEEEEEVMFDEYSLRGFRFFTNILNGEHHDEEDIEDEDEDENENIAEEEEREQKPTSEYITRKLIEKGITMEAMVQSHLAGCHEEYANNQTMTMADNMLYGKVRCIISNYVPVQQQVIVQPSSIINEEAQPKHSNRVMAHDYL